MATADKAFILNNHSIAPPIGSLVSFLGVKDPGDGWVICDGVQRTDGGDGKYNTLITMGIGSGIANVNYTPPNLKGSFLRGTGTDPTGNYVGPSIKTTQNHATQSHNHTATVNITDPGHNHSFQTYNDDFTSQGGQIGQRSFAVPDSNNAIDYTSTGPSSFLGSYNNDNGGMSLSLNTNLTSASYKFIANSRETRPYNYGVNWIIKY